MVRIGDMKVDQIYLLDLVRYHITPKEIREEINRIETIKGINLRKFLRAVNLLDKKGYSTELYLKLNELLNTRPSDYTKVFPEQIFLEIVWIELLLNSSKGNFYQYLKDFPVLRFSKEDFEEYLERERGLALTTAKSYTGKILYTLKNTDWSKWFFRIKNGKNPIIERKGFYDLSSFGLAYALYRIEKEKNGYNGSAVRFIVNRDNDVAKVLHLHLMAISQVKAMLRGLSDRKILSVDLVADLDNIHFREDMNSVRVIDKAIDYLTEGLEVKNRKKAKKRFRR